jgi:hypothetical protein
MYVLARRDLSETYRLVQAMLKIWHMELLKKEKIFSSFYEPDLDGQVTAIACYDDGRIFKDLRLA